MSEERNTEKHSITTDDLDFLITLQHEMNTQDTVCQADPRFWVVQGTEKVYVGEEYAEGEELVSEGESLDITTLEEAVEYFQTHIAEYNGGSTLYEVTLEPSDNGKWYDLTQIEKDCNENTVERYEEGEEIIEQYTDISSISELVECLEDIEVISVGRYSVACYRKEHHIYPSTMFLTNRECKEHIERNHYHYSSDAHSYAMTAWRSPQVERLYDILQKVDWKALKEAIHE